MYKKVIGHFSNKTIIINEFDRIKKNKARV